MDEYIGLMQNLQDTYATQTGLCLVITDAEGRWLTRPSGQSVWLTALEDTDRPGMLNHGVLGIARSVETLNQPADFEYKPGIKLMAASFTVSETDTLYSWAAFFTDSRSRHILQSYYEGEDREGALYRELRDSVPELNGERKRQLAERLGAMTRIARILMQSDNERTSARRLLVALREMSSFIEQPDGRLRDILQQFFYLRQGIDFLGFAIRLDESRFQVIEVLGEQGFGLTGSTFSLGEGFLGQTATTRQPGKWANISRDPRVVFFRQNNIALQSLFTFPVSREGNVAGILFGGSRTLRAIPTPMIDLAQTLSLFLGAQLGFRSLREELSAHYTKLSMVMEISRSVTLAEDIKRVLFILIDMSLNLAQGAFSSAMLGHDKDKVQMVSRGLSQPQVEQYIKELSERYDGYQPQQPFYGEIALSEFQGMAVLECPLVYQYELLGVLSVALKEKSAVEELHDFILTLSIAGSAAIERIQQEKHPAGADAVQLLHRTLRQWDESAYVAVEKASVLAGEFANQRGMAFVDIRLAEEACLSSTYEPALVEDVLDADLVHILKQMRQGIETNSTGQPERESGPHQEIVQIALLALEHAYEGKGLTNKRVKPVDRKLREEFQAFLSRKEVLDLELTLTIPAAGREEHRIDPLQAVRELNLLSTREHEVLSLVANGASNREIAEDLFISEHTVKNHMTNIFHKLGVTDRSQLIAMVYQQSFGQGGD